MPKSKRSRIVDLCKTRKHGKELKKRLHEEVQSCIDNYTNVFVFSVTDMRNAKLKNVRDKWKHSRFFIGKNKVMARAFGFHSGDAYKPNIHLIGNRLRGQCGLLFSNKPKDEVIEWFDSFSENDYARSGNVATELVLLREGPLTQFPHSMEPHLKLLGLPTTLQKGIIHLVSDYEVCKKGDILTPEAAKILKLLGYEMAEFRININCVWSKDGVFEVLKETINESSEQQKEENDDDSNDDEVMDASDEPQDNNEEISTLKDNAIPAINGNSDIKYSTPENKKSVKQEELKKDLITPVKNDKSSDVTLVSPSIKGEEYSEKDKIRVVSAALSETNTIYSSPDDKSPIFRSLRNRTVTFSTKKTTGKISKSRKSSKI